MNKTPHRVSVGLSDFEYQALRRMAEKHGASIALIGRHAIAEFLVRQESAVGITLFPFEERYAEIDEKPSKEGVKRGRTGK